MYVTLFVYSLLFANRLNHPAYNNPSDHLEEYRHIFRNCFFSGQYLFMQQLVILPDKVNQIFRYFIRFTRNPALLAAFQNHRHFLAVYAQGDRSDAVRLVTLTLGAFTFCLCGHVIPPSAALLLFFLGDLQQGVFALISIDAIAQ